MKIGPMKIGMVCYASVGGSGIVATELSKVLARRGHQVHLISTDTPFRLGEFQPGLTFHKVITPTYPLFREPQYLLALANRIVQLSRAHDLDLVHAHYAVPHATAAFLSREVLAAGGATLKVVTTLHGTDITLVGSDPSYSEIVAFSIEQSDGVTAVSRSLRDSTCTQLGVTREIRVIPNFLDSATHGCLQVSDLRRRFTGGDPDVRIVIHVSNFRPVKRVETVVAIFDRIRQRLPARLLLVGDGPDLAAAQRQVRDLGLSHLVHAVGEQEAVLPLLSIADVFLLPSAEESFGLAALEAMACGVPVIASNVGGLPETIEDGVTGFLHPPEAMEAMAASAITLLEDPERRRAVGEAARLRVQRHFDADGIVSQYEAYYREVLG
ncbi:MAG: N-acetyl-alpha-D-glucosaminyl L-malate synthase BshA [Vicinamibacterales bacterium]